MRKNENETRISGMPPNRNVPSIAQYGGAKNRPPASELLRWRRKSWSWWRKRIDCERSCVMLFVSDVPHDVLRGVEQAPALTSPHWKSS